MLVKQGLVVVQNDYIVGKGENFETTRLQLAIASRCALKMAGGILESDTVQTKFKFSVVQGHI